MDKKRDLMQTLTTKESSTKSGTFRDINDVTQGGGGGKTKRDRRA